MKNFWPGYQNTSNTSIHLIMEMQQNVYLFMNTNSPQRIWIIFLKQKDLDATLVTA